MKNSVPDKKQDVSQDVPGVNRRNIQTSPDDVKSSKDQKNSDFKARQGNQQSQNMTDGAEGEGV